MRPLRIDGAVIASEVFLLRFFGREGDRLLLVNLGSDRDLTPSPEPLLAPRAGRRWEVAWSSESVQYGGNGTPDLHPDSVWHIPGEAAMLLRCARTDDDDGE